jgi:LacI family transcriptional regulator
MSAAELGGNVSDKDGTVKKVRRSTISDVAALAKVDPSVVSRLLNNDARLSIRDSTRQRVLDAVEMLGYRPNVAARSLRTAKTRTLALLIPDFANPVYAEIIKGAERAAARGGCVLVTGSVGEEGTTQTYLDLLGHGRVDGLLLATGTLSAEVEAQLERLGLPWLLINQIGRSAQRYVVVDDERAAATAVSHLVELGHERIAHLAGPRGTDTARRRRRGYVEAMRRHGIEPDPNLVVAAGYSPEHGATMMEKLLSQDSPPTAVFVANLASAIGALHTAHRMGVRVPAELSLIAVHDLPLAAHLVPPLTTVRMPLTRLGERAVEILLESETQQQVHEVVREPIELVIRESTAPPPTGARGRR